MEKQNMYFSYRSLLFSRIQKLAHNVKGQQNIAINLHNFITRSSTNLHDVCFHFLQSQIPNK